MNRRGYGSSCSGSPKWAKSSGLPNAVMSTINASAIVSTITASATKRFVCLVPSVFTERELPVGADWQQSPAHPRGEHDGA